MCLTLEKLLTCFSGARAERSLYINQVFRFLNITGYEIGIIQNKLNKFSLFFQVCYFVLTLMQTYYGQR